MKIIFVILAVAFCFAVGQALNCYYCKVGVGSLCYTTETTCNSGEQCYSGEGKAVGFIKIKIKGCLAVGNCNKTTDETYSIAGSNGTVYTMTKTCCNTDLCNAAPDLPGSSALSLALATISALFVANILV